MSEDLAERLKIQEKNAKLLNVDVEQMKELDKDMDSKRIDQFYQSYRGIMQLAINMIDMGNKGAGGSVTIKVADKFKVEELFEELYEGKNKSFIFKPIDSKYENVAGKILRDWNIVFDTSEISKLKSVKQETEAVDWGGPSKEFMSLVWKRLHKLKVEAKGSKDGQMISVDLVYRDETGYLMLQKDERLQNFLESITAIDVEKTREKIDAYYQAIGKLFLHSLVSHWHSTDIEKGSRLMIPSTALPPFYRQCKWANTWPCHFQCQRHSATHNASHLLHFSSTFYCSDLLRGCKPGDEDYPNYEVMRDINEMGFSVRVEEIIGKPPDNFFCNGDEEPLTDETFYSKFLPAWYLDTSSIALENVKKGLTLEGYVPLPTILKSIPSKALDKIAFANLGYESAADVIAFLEPVYCKEVMLPDEMGILCEVAVEDQVIESQRLFFEQTLPNLLRDVHAAEKANQEKYVKDTRKRKDFLSVRHSIKFPILFYLFTCCSTFWYLLTSIYLIYERNTAFCPLRHCVVTSSRSRVDGDQGQDQNRIQWP